MTGGASQEVAIQKQREVRVLEAVYPRPSAIPERFVIYNLESSGPVWAKFHNIVVDLIGPVRM